MAKLLLCLDGTVVKEFRLNRERFTVGRRPTNDIQIDNLAVSGEHAALLTVGGDVFVEDLDSTNGTVVNGKPTKRQLLQDGDEIIIGKYMLKFWSENAAGSDAGTDYEKTMMLRVPPAVAAAAPAPAPVAAAPRPVVAASAAAVAASAVQTGARPAEPASSPGVVKVLTGGNAGRELMLTKNLTTLGKAGVQVAVITRRPQGYFITHVEGAQTPKVNGVQIGQSARKLEEEDLIELLGVQMAFFTH
ncbi:FHA domain-containing protein [Andreprevotia lacus DSM 23236]|jgi:pSer/pThr/pTyr-binding forkhead associated (FHA) protein|uniref:FHA domain-containing protein n=1 Tax=Andreprevotia lacus DSM 23236 TaxID=1121001 RepID=A0A1W1X2C6_9NEIS|nr:FHA domain-containing protein [Andreprevotia lacus]SMC18047.1 FHA domain-containing protein [Andreprevotia lacus DSM 23236]